MPHLLHLLHQARTYQLIHGSILTQPAPQLPDPDLDFEDTFTLPVPIRHTYLYKSLSHHLPSTTVRAGAGTADELERGVCEGCGG